MRYIVNELMLHVMMQLGLWLVAMLGYRLGTGEFSVGLITALYASFCVMADLIYGVMMVGCTTEEKED